MAYLAQDNAIKSLMEKEADTALMYLDKAVALQPREASFWELRGDAWKMSDKLDNAEKAYTTAIDKNPSHFSSYLARGILRHERGQKDRGLIDIKRSYEILPTPEASFYLGEAALAAKQHQQASRYFQQARQAGGELGRKASKQLTVVQLQLQPQGFLSATLSYSEQGYLLVTISNNSPVGMDNIQLKLTVAGQRQILRLPQALAAGRQSTLSTGIRPQVNSNERTAYQVQVVAAEPFN
jgi:tetratricopeptide (TPR) repeat protein